ncbi:MAG: helix-turn-helix transcriptional regulator [Acidovorax sp.]|jgi:AraC-like DNA-binding protein/mannose-6-phosphate isomerase-like protein (cupin superfamily)|nr:helix-turn-helix transcriptional regulator [Acidovorax sp.]
MHNQPLDAVDTTDRTVLALSTRYDPDTLLPWHQHRRAQLLYGATGVMQVQTAQGAWAVPPQQAVWIPAAVPHQVRMLGVTTRSLYIEPAQAPRADTGCVVLAASALLRQLLAEAVQMPLHYDPAGRDGALVTLLLHEVAAAPTLPLHLPQPADPRLAALCADFLQAPDIHQPAQDWAQRLHLSLRSFGRHFQAQTGISFQQWRQRACVAHALARLAAGAAVGTVALEMGYDSAGAFSTMFRRITGSAPSALDRHDTM